MPLAPTEPHTEPADSLAPAGPLRVLAGLVEHPDFAHLADGDFFAEELALLHSPMLLPDIELGVDLLRAAVAGQRRILLVGDRDVDGVSSASLLGNFLNEVHVSAGGRLEINLSDDGDDYGLSGEFFQNILRDPADLIILLDMGSSHGPEIAQLAEAGAKVVILDHHQLHLRVPDQEGVAFINPRRREDVLENDGQIATVGLVFKFLLGYALAFTKEWTAGYFLTPPAGGPGLLFRYGACLGSFDNLAAAREAWGDRLAITESLPGDGRPLSPAEWERLQAAPETAGRLLFYRHIVARPRLRDFIRKLTDLVAVGLITDMVPLTGENRALVRLGLGLAVDPRGSTGNGSKGSSTGNGLRPERPFCPGLRALIDSLRLPAGDLRSRDVGFSIGPALNAAGRMGRTRLALEVLTSQDARTARPQVEALLDLNQQRKERTARNESLAAEYFDRHPEKAEEPLIFCFHPDFFPGVSGILATRLTERYRRPAAFLHPEGAHVKGSIRTWGDRNMLRLLEKAGDLFTQYGGHPQAAGFTLETDALPELEKRLVRAARELEARETAAAAEEAPAYHLELSPARLDYGTLGELTLLEPFGSGNPEPVFRLSAVRVYDIRELSGGKHARFKIVGTPAGVEAVFWGGGAELLAKAEHTDVFDLYGSLEVNTFRGQRNLQLRVSRIQARKPVGGAKN